MQCACVLDLYLRIEDTIITLSLSAVIVLSLSRSSFLPFKPDRPFAKSFC